MSYSFRPKYAGAFLYHCGTAPVLMHIGSGMCGAIVVNPATPLAPPHEFVLVQNEFYLGTPPGNAIHGVQTFEVAAGGGMVFEFLADVPGSFPFVNHAFGHGQKGAIGVLVVD